MPAREPACDDVSTAGISAPTGPSLHQTWVLWIKTRQDWDTGTKINGQVCIVKIFSKTKCSSAFFSHATTPRPLQWAALGAARGPGDHHHHTTFGATGRKRPRAWKHTALGREKGRTTPKNTGVISNNTSYSRYTYWSYSGLLVK